MRTMKAHLDNLERQLKPKTLKLGFPAGATYPDGESVAVVAYTNEMGQPANNQPPRPFFRKAIAEHEDKWRGIVTKALRAGESVDAALSLVGEEAVADVKQSIIDLTDPPLSTATLYNRKHRSNKPKNFTDKPLLDTREMTHTVQYWVGENESTSNS